MIVLADLDLNDVTTYHTEPHIIDMAAKMVNIKGRSEYTSLKTSIQSVGIKDPVLAMCSKQRVCMVEVGEQRVLIARELGLTTIRALVYNTYNAKIMVNYSRRIYNIEEFDRIVTHNVRGPDDKYIQIKDSIPVVKTLRKYLAAGIATL